jgi:release factor glutamine methyltransferase
MRVLTIPGVFRPRSDSRLLARLLAAVIEPGRTVLDPFTGTGVLAVTAALAGAEATAVDVSRRAVVCAWLNGLINGARIRVRRGDMFAPVRGERFDVIVANPPYLPTASDAEPRGAARAWEGGADGRRVLDRLCRTATEHLTPGGRLLVVHSSVCGPEATADILGRAGMDVEVIARERGPLGPLLRNRARALERRGILAPGQREEDIVVFSATPRVKVSGVARTGTPVP